MLSEDDYEAITAEKGAYFLAGLKDLKNKHKCIGDVDGIGMALRMELCSADDSYTPDKDLGKRLPNEAFKGDLVVDGKRYGLALDVGGYYKNVVNFAPNIHITKPEIDLAMSLLDQLLTRLTK
jgi:4-aminobutyrate aminotransferase-like enzyme